MPEEALVINGNYRLTGIEDGLADHFVEVYQHFQSLGVESVAAAILTNSYIEFKRPRNGG